MDWATRKVLAWRLSNTMEVDFCIEALEEALARFGSPEIFNTDQGSQFTSPRFTAVLKDAGVKISMDGRGRWMDNVFIERLWRSLKYECVYIHAFETGSALRSGLACRRLDQLLQHPSASFSLRWTAPRRGVFSNRAATVSGACPGDGGGHPCEFRRIPATPLVVERFPDRG